MCTPKVFSLYSVTGTLFLLFVYTLLSTQPFFIRGINDVERAKQSALGGMMFFVFSLLGSLSLLLWRNRRGVRNGNGSIVGGGSRYELIDGASERDL